MLDRNEMNLFTKNIRSYFPIYESNPNLIYLDSGATALKPKCVLDAMNDYYTDYGVNIHRGVYHLSYKATLEYDKARANIASFINAKESEIIFTRNASESLNMICLMYAKLLNDGDEVLSCYLEHHSSILPWQIACKERGLKLTYIPLNEEYRLTKENLIKTISEKSKVLAINYVSNVMGYVTEMKELIRIAHEHGMIVIVDASQAIMHFDIDVKDLDCDFLAFSGHKMYGPTGVGIIYGKKKILKQLKPILYGGDMNEEVYPDSVDIKEVPYCFEAGTPAIAEGIGLSRAVDFIREVGFDKIKEHDESLVEYAKEKLSKIEGITVYNKNMDVPVIAFNINGVHPHDAASFFDEAGICLRAGHHCAQLLTKALGVNGTLRASLSIYNNYDDIDALVETIIKVVDFFKSLEVK